MRSVEAEFMLATTFHWSSPKKGVHQFRLISWFLFSFLVKIIMEIAITLCGNDGIDFCSHNCQTLTVLINKGPRKLQVLLEHLEDNMD